MKKIIPILLLLVVCISHMNIVDAIGHFSAKYNTAALEKNKDMPLEKETEKEAKEKTGGEEKFCNKDNLAALGNYKLSGNGKYVQHYTLLHKNPYHDRDNKPPNPFA